MQDLIEQAKAELNKVQQRIDHCRPRALRLSSPDRTVWRYRLSNYILQRSEIRAEIHELERLCNRNPATTILGVLA